jgi:DNA-binding NarL/FixJ family response regulator
MDSVTSDTVSPTSVRILLVEDQAIVRRGIASLLRLTQGFEVIAEAENGMQAVELAEQLRPEMVLMDIGMPLLNGVMAAERIKAKDEGIKIIMLTSYDSEDFVMDALASGADGYVLKNATPESLSAAVRTVMEGGGFYSPSFTPDVVQRLRDKLEGVTGNELTPREREVLQLIAEGKSHQHIAELLHLSIRTVDTHRNNIMQKLNIHDAVALVRYALKRGLAEI